MMTSFPSIPNYYVTRHLGSGTFGDVFHAVYLGHPAREVAIKVLASDVDEDVKRFIREARILTENLHNQYVVDVLDYSLNTTPAYIVLEYCSMGSLRSWVTVRRSWRDVAAILGHAVAGLAGLHSRGGFHRDIKPENLLLSQRADGKVVLKVADFGLARLPRAGTQMSFRPGGTPGYMAPELGPGGLYSSASDIYSLGVTGVELLCGLRDADALRRTDCPAAFRSLLLQMMSPSASSRPDARQIAEALQGIVRGDRELAAAAARPPAPQAARVPAPVPAAQPQGGGLAPWLLLGGGLALLGAIAAGGGGSYDPSVDRVRGSDGRFKRR